MRHALRRVRIVMMRVILVGAITTAAAGENLSAGKTQRASASTISLSSGPFPTTPEPTNTYGRPVPVPETPGIFLGMAGIGVMLILRRFFKR